MEEDDFNRFPTGKIAKGSWCDHCARFNSRPSVCDIIIIRKNNNKVLLEKRNINPQKGWWALCGGYLNWDEDLEKCAMREVKEELGYELKEIIFFRNFSSPKRDPSDKQGVGHVFYVFVEQDPPQIDSQEVQEIGWFDLDNLPENIAFDHREMLEEFMKSYEFK